MIRPMLARFRTNGPLAQPPPHSADVVSARANLAVAGLLWTALLIRIPTLMQPLVEIHPFRQTQTAFTAVQFFRDGVDLFRPVVPVLGPDSVVPHEFPAFQAIATLPMALGLPADPSLRLTGLLMFLVTGLGVFILMKHLDSSDLAAVGATAAFLFSPFSLLWGRAAVIEFLPTAAALAYCVFGIRWRQGGGWRSLTGCAVLGALAMVCKPTTGALYLVIPMLFPVPRIDRRTLLSVSAGALALVAGGAWTLYADAVKATCPSTAFLTSAALARQFAMFSPRPDPHALGEVMRRIHLYLAGGALEIWVPLALLASVRARLGTLVSILCVAILLFWVALAGYLVIHEYALIAIAPLIAMLAGLGLDFLWRMRYRLAGRGLAAALVLVWAFSLLATTDYWGRAFAERPDPMQVLPVARYIHDLVPPDQQVAILGRDWSPAVLYYSERRGLMVRKEEEPTRSVDELVREGYEYVLRCPFYSPTCVVLAQPKEPGR